MPLGSAWHELHKGEVGQEKGAERADSSGFGVLSVTGEWWSRVDDSVIPSSHIALSGSGDLGATVIALNAGRSVEAISFTFSPPVFLYSQLHSLLCLRERGSQQKRLGDSLSAGICVTSWGSALTPPLGICGWGKG